MRVAHHVEPFVGGGLAVAMQEMANAIDEDLGAAPGNTVEACSDQAIDDVRNTEAR